MTKLLQQAILCETAEPNAQIQQLSPEQQDAAQRLPWSIASRFLDELQDEQKWEARFASTTDDQWDQMAAMVRQEIVMGETTPLSEVFPTQK
jgi:hypothetical protein